MGVTTPHPFVDGFCLACDKWWRVAKGNDSWAGTVCPVHGVRLGLVEPAAGPPAKATAGDITSERRP